MDESKLDVATCVEQWAVLLDLPLPPEYFPGVVDNFARIMAIAKLVNEFPLPEAIEAAPTFQP
ncbi:MAG: DUF4089 domain-containing protein [Cyanothece sp. SIO1E1]|nr:DUF4089 domain-containing protein [Cyanothece sp. SIO1E1]